MPSLVAAVLFDENLPWWKAYIDNTLVLPGSRHQFEYIEVYELNGLRVKAVERLMWLAHWLGAKNKLLLLKCPRCEAQLFRVDGFLYCILDTAAGPVSTALKLDPEISDAVITCQQCGDEIRVKDAAVELMKLIVSSGAQWMWL